MVDYLGSPSSLNTKLFNQLGEDCDSRKKSARWRARITLTALGRDLLARNLKRWIRLEEELGGGICMGWWIRV
ncbi:hypothetical protein JTE90_022285 [Oedothorax gibbosus]|uniref:HTH marR-type domain-containing protein n=1 Tax=Oedothorax gibbosus TaxID=931172 RepID=A0AAV6VUQ4_9ARAC|nr:hypothetical protein JTE90_022285 [Oedothorax gibbosus]